MSDVTDEREATHGKFGETAHCCQALKSTVRAFITLNFSPRAAELTWVQKESLDMICSKIARICCGDPNHADHWRDIAGFATLVLKDLQKK